MQHGMSDTTPPAKTLCPICNRPTDPRYRPFCSRRCADVDLAKWLRGSYRIPTDEGAGQQGAPDEVSPDGPDDDRTIN